MEQEVTEIRTMLQGISARLDKIEADHRQAADDHKQLQAIKQILADKGEDPSAGGPYKPEDI